MRQALQCEGHAATYTRVEAPDPRSSAVVHPEFVPPRLLLLQQLPLAARQVALVTYDAERRSLVAVQGRQP